MTTPTRVLVTGAAGGFGAALLTRLAARDGVQAVGFDVREPRPGALPANVEIVLGDVRDAAAVERAMRGCTAAVHLAWVVGSMRDRAARRAIDLGGTANVLAAMDRTGCRRLVFASSVTAYGSGPDHPAPFTEDDPLQREQPSAYASHKAQAEEMIAAAGVERGVARAAVVVGRATDNSVRTVFAAPVLAAVRGDDARVQVVHHDDVGRFYAEAVLGTRTGPVNLAAADVLTMDDAARILGKRVVRLPERAVRAFVGGTWALRAGAIDPGEFNSMRYLPIVDTTRLREDWGFEPQYSTASALADFRRSLDGVVALGRWTVNRPGRARNDGSETPDA